MVRAKSQTSTAEETTAGQLVRDRILSAAFAAFTEHGYTQASTLDIATRARVSKRELYALFGSKQQMLVACIAERAKRMRLPAERPPLRDHKDLHAALVAFGSVLLSEISDPDVIAVFRLAVAEADRSAEVAQALDGYGRKAARTALREILEQAQSAGLLNGADPDRMASQFTALLWEDLMVGLMLGLAARPGPGEVRRRARNAADAFMRLHSPRDSAAPVEASRD